VLEAAQQQAGFNQVRWDTLIYPPDTAILNDPLYALPLIPRTPSEYPSPLPAVDRSQFLPLEQSGIRVAWAGVGRLWGLIRGEPTLGRVSIGVRTDGQSYVLLVEGPPVTIEFQMRAGAAMAGDDRVREFAVRPVAPGDPVMGDTSRVFPLRRYANAPRSQTLLFADALPLANGLELEPHEIEEIRSVALAEGAVRASVVLFETRLLNPRPSPDAPITVEVPGGWERYLEAQGPHLMFADGSSLDAKRRFLRQLSISRAIEKRLAGRRISVSIVDVDDPLLDADGYAITIA
jgi:hypothetical protein